MPFSKIFVFQTRFLPLQTARASLSSLSPQSDGPSDVHNKEAFYPSEANAEYNTPFLIQAWIKPFQAYQTRIKSLKLKIPSADVCGKSHGRDMLRAELAEDQDWGVSPQQTCDTWGIVCVHGGGVFLGVSPHCFHFLLLKENSLYFHILGCCFGDEAFV